MATKGKDGFLKPRKLNRGVRRMYFKISKENGIEEIESLPKNQDVMVNNDFENWLHHFEVNAEAELTGTHYAEVDNDFLADLLWSYDVKRLGE